MENIRMFRTATGEDIIAEFEETTEYGDVYKNAIQLIVVPSKDSPGQQNFGFAPFPQFVKPKGDSKLTMNPDKGIIFYIDIEPDFLDQYNQVFGNIVAPSQKIFLGS